MISEFKDIVAKHAITLKDSFSSDGTFCLNKKSCEHFIKRYCERVDTDFAMFDIFMDKIVKAIVLNERRLRASVSNANIGVSIEQTVFVGKYSVHLLLHRGQPCISDDLGQNIIVTLATIMNRTRY